jgi:hypothetical protein
VQLEDAVAFEPGVCEAGAADDGELVVGGSDAVAGFGVEDRAERVQLIADREPEPLRPGISAWRLGRVVEEVLAAFAGCVEKRQRRCRCSGAGAGGGGEEEGGGQSRRD